MQLHIVEMSTREDNCPNRGCPRHGARFDVRTGKVLTFPAIVDIPAYQVRLEGGEVQIAFPVEDE